MALKKYVLMSKQIDASCKPVVSHGCPRIGNSTTKHHSWELRNSLMGNKKTVTISNDKCLGLKTYQELSFIPCELTDKGKEALKGEVTQSHPSRM